ncbi:MAG TPA: Ig-like domain-containing protein [Luteolibacter sp.]
MKASPLFTTLLCLALTGQVFAAKVIPNHAIADLVLGQPNFNSSTVLVTTNSFAFSYPTAVVVDPVTRKVFVSDFGNDRVLRFSSAAALVNGNPAEAVLGQPNFTGNTSAVSQSRMSLPGGLFLDRLGRLWVADTFNNRVIMFNSASLRSTLAPADKVLGQPDFITKTAGTTDKKMYEPLGVWVDSSDTLWVADSGNHRVLRFNTVTDNPVQNSAANAVLGQANFTTGLPGSGTSGFNNPTSLAVSGAGALFVACANDNRVLRFNNALSLPSGLNNASAVLGQLNLAETGAGLSATRMDKPYGVTVTADDTLWVCEGGNHRTTRFSYASTLNNGAAANGVVGQPNFITNTDSTTNRGLNRPLYAPFIDATGSLWVSDDKNNRILRFPPDVTKPLLTVTSSVPQKTSKKELSIKGTASDVYGVAKVQYQIGTGTLKTATGTTSWQFKAPLNLGKNKITIFATDSVGNTSLVKIIKVERLSDGTLPDETKPLLTVTSVVPQKTSKKELLIEGTAKDASGIKNVRYRIGSGDLKTAAGTTSWQFKAPLKIGDNKITIFAKDLAGNNSLVRTIHVERVDDSIPPDETKPLLTVTSNVPKKTVKKKFLIKGTATDASGITKIQYRVGKGSLKTASGTTTWKCKPRLKLGKNKITIFATDSAGNTSVVKKIKIKRVAKVASQVNGAEALGTDDVVDD